MKYITNTEFHFQNTAVALGKFEGIHRGHQLLIHRVLDEEMHGLASMVFTFDRPPRITLKGDEGYRQIYTKEERHRILEQMDVDILVEHPFTKEFAALTPKRFIRDVLVAKAGARVIVVGKDFRFGKKRSGSVKDLYKYQEEYGYQLVVIDKLQMDGKDVSSTRIRACLEKGDMESAERLLGRTFSISGPVIHGKQLGRKIQIPTINLIPGKEKLLPPMGVYISRIREGDSVYFGMTNVGMKPTVKDSPEVNVETYIFDYDGNLYGRDVRVELMHHTRPERKFANLEELKSQLDLDLRDGRDYLARYSPAL